jgi:hypothetical protein
MELTEFLYDPQSVDVVGFSFQSQARSMERNSGQFRYGTILVLLELTEFPYDPQSVDGFSLQSHVYTWYYTLHSS